MKRLRQDKAAQKEVPMKRLHNAKAALTEVPMRHLRNGKAVHKEDPTKRLHNAKAVRNAVLWIEVLPNQEAALLMNVRREVLKEDQEVAAEARKEAAGGQDN